MYAARCQYALEGDQKANSDWTSLSLHFSNQSADVEWVDLFQARQKHLKEEILFLKLLTFCK